MIGRILFGLCSVLLTIIMVIVMLTIHNLPKLMRLMLAVIRQVFYLSYLVYRWILECLQGLLTRQQIKLNLFVNPARSIACGLLSLLCMLMYHLVRSKPIALLSCTGWLSHGLLIGYLWQDFFEPDGLEMGDKLW
jgi:hypothetical protein